jgi:hypothetical protein
LDPPARRLRRRATGRARQPEPRFDAHHDLVIAGTLLGTTNLGGVTLTSDVLVPFIATYDTTGAPLGGKTIDVGVAASLRSLSFGPSGDALLTAETSGPSSILFARLSPDLDVRWSWSVRHATPPTPERTEYSAATARRFGPNQAFVFGVFIDDLTLDGTTLDATPTGDGHDAAVDQTFDFFGRITLDP